ncbi:hypothetical protein BH24DEI2_BH24DEI2_28680 [soil metagenome]
MSCKSVSRYDTPTMNELLLRIFGEEHRHLIHATLADLDEEYPATPGVDNESVSELTSPQTARPTDPFEAIGAELRREERLDFLEAFKR